MLKHYRLMNYKKFDVDKNVFIPDDHVLMLIQFNAVI